MADNITGSPYGSNDVGLTVGIELGNIDRSTEQAGALADQIKQWRENNEAFIKSIADTQEALAMLTTEFDKQNSLRKETVAAEESLRDITAQVRDNARSTAQAYQEINGVLSTMNTNLGINMVPGLGAVGNGTSFGNAGRAATSSSWDSGDVSPSMVPPSSSGSSPSPSVPSMPSMGGGDSTVFDPTMDDDMYGGDSEYDEDTATGGGSGSGSGSVWKKTLKGMGSKSGTSAGEREISRILSLPGYKGMGKVGVYARYINRVTNGGLFRAAARHPRLVGTPRVSTSSIDALAKHYAGGVAAELEAGGTVVSAEHAKILYNSHRAQLAGLEGSKLSELGSGLEGAGLVSSEEALAAGAGGAELAGGALGVLGAAAAPVGIGLAVGAAAYKGYSFAEQAGKMSGSLTGDTGIVAGLNIYGQAAGMSGFGFNPLMSNETAMQIMSTGLGKGYRGGLMNDYKDYAYRANTKYGIDPQQSMQQFQDAVVVAGGSVSNLTKNLDSLANTAANTRSSIGQLQANQGTYTSILSGMGMGNATSDIATAAATAMSGDLVLGKAPSSISMMGTLQGQAMTAMQMGIPMSQLYSAGKTTLGAMQIAGATEDFQRKILQGIVGVSPQSPGFDAAVESKWLQLSTVLNQIAPPTGDQEPWNAKRAVEYTKKILKHIGGAAEGIIGEANRSITGMLGGEALASDKGMTNLFSNLQKTVLGKGKETIGGHKANDVMVQYKDEQGHQKTVESSAIANMDYHTKMDIYKQMAAGGYHVAQAYKDSDGKIHQGKMETMGKELGNSVMDAYERGKISTQQLLALTPEAKTLVTLLKDPAMASRNITRHAANTGYGSGSHAADHSSTGGIAGFFGRFGRDALDIGAMAAGVAITGATFGAATPVGLSIAGAGAMDLMHHGL